MTATKEKFFNPARASASDKAAAIDSTAKAIVAAEASAREKKTERLRALRLQQEPSAEEKAADSTKKKTKKPVRRGKM